MSREKEFFYETIAEEFDSVMNRYDVEKRVRLVFTRLLRQAHGCLVLDAGCGTGWFSRAASSHGARVVSLDLGVGLLAQVRRKCETRAVVGSVLDLPFGAGAFDAVISSEVIEHTPDPRRAVREMARVLRPGGTLALTVPNRAWKAAVIIANALHLRPYCGLENWPSRRALVRWLQEAGLDVEELFGFHIVPFVFPFLYPAIDWFDRFGGRLAPIMLNLAVRAMKPR